MSMFVPRETKRTYETPKDDAEHKTMLKEVFTSYAEQHAVRFDVLREGPCAVRASYAAYQLAKVFRDCAGITVYLKSYTSRDQYLVMFGSKESGWHVYDALTNPELIFEPAFYKIQILKKFALVPPPIASKKTAMDLIITPDLITRQMAFKPAEGAKLRAVMAAADFSVRALESYCDIQRALNAEVKGVKSRAKILMQVSAYLTERFQTPVPGREISAPFADEASSGGTAAAAPKAGAGAAAPEK